MWTLILVTVVFSGSVTGGVAANTTFLDFPDEAKCRAAAAAPAGERACGDQRSRRPPEYLATSLLPHYCSLC
jgi:hypothetical protein